LYLSLFPGIKIGLFLRDFRIFDPIGVPYDANQAKRGIPFFAENPL
jgi:hypothetical protein